MTGVTAIANIVPQRSQTVTYTSFDRPATITENNYKATFTYDASGDRKVMKLEKNNATEYTRYYLSDNYEFDQKVTGTKEKLYLGGDYYTAPAVFVRDNGNSGTIYYICRDYLGSITHITTSSGSLVQELSYDAWGRLRNPSNRVAYTPGSEPELFLGRGYTGHEHLTQFGLINMNARLYDPAVGRFLSPDPYVQDPFFGQSFNRYSYALNNPLKYTDPNGEFWFIIIGALIGAYIGGSTAEGNLNPLQWNWDKNTFVGMGIGAGVGALGGWGFSAVAPAFSSVAVAALPTFSSASVTISAYALTGAVFGGAIGYGSGFGTAMYTSNGDWGYAHKMGTTMSGVGSQIGLVLGIMAGNWEAYQEQLRNLKAMEMSVDKAIGNAREEYYQQRSGGLGADFYGGAGMAAVSETLYSKDLGTWMGKNGTFYDQSWGGNQYTGGKYKFANNLAKPFKYGSNALGAYDMYTSVMAAKKGEISPAEATGDVVFGGAAMYNGFWGGWANIWYNLGKEYGPMTTYLRKQADRRNRYSY